ncbi:MAG: LysM peptidoglycan-binding domain-containing protein [Bacteroidales bacterium]|nr:LysM peptidoglycan-binding domain-containing protein [Bacteroidales bacterium]
MKENPDLKNGLKTGQELKIPLETGDFVERKFIFHTVDKGETLYSISKKYSVEVSSITALNPDVENGLKAKTIIKIAINPENVKSAQENINKDFVFHEGKR